MTEEGERERDREGGKRREGGGEREGLFVCFSGEGTYTTLTVDQVLIIAFHFVRYH